MQKNDPHAYKPILLQVQMRQLVRPQKKVGGRVIRKYSFGTPVMLPLL
jgi:hypothetical protein